MHEDDEHYRRRLYTVLPNLETLACGPSVAIRLVKNRPIHRLIVPARPDYIESDQLERVITALRSSPGCPGCPTVRQLVIERRLASRAGLQCVVKELKDLRVLSLIVSYASDVRALSLDECVLQLTDFFCNRPVTLFGTALLNHRSILPNSLLMAARNDRGI